MGDTEAGARVAEDMDRALSLTQASRILSLPVERFESLAADAVVRPTTSESGRYRYARSDIERLTSCCQSGTHHHAVQFFDRDDFLCEEVARYLAEGFEVDAPLVVIARPERLRAIGDTLRRQGRNVDEALANGQLCMFDAHRTLARFMRDGMPQASDFRAVIGPVIERGRAAYPRARLRAYGEMVDILWVEGRPDAAIRLEMLWNELATDLPFSLLCGYSMSNFEGADDAERFARVCATHSEVSPAESCTHPGKLDAHRREVARMQQRIRALEAMVRKPPDEPAAPEASKAATELKAAAPTTFAVKSALSGQLDQMCVLIVDDDAIARRLLLESLNDVQQPRIRVLEADSVSVGLERLEQGDPDLCICDFRLSASETALDLFRAARARGSHVPFIGITGNLLEEDLAETLLTAGFDDVVLKRDLEATDLHRLLRHAALRGRSARRLVEISTRDGMTGALNRQGFFDRLETERRRCGGEAQVLSLLYLDLDDLKRINDGYGHRAGDQMIKSMVAELRTLLRERDAIGRLGGDEFCVVLPGADAAMAEQIAARLRHRLCGNPISLGGRMLEVSASIGLHTVSRAADTSVEEMVDRADQAMFRDKQIGKARASRLPAPSAAVSQSM